MRVGRRLAQIVLLAAAAPTVASAQDPVREADELYRQGQAFLSAGNLSEACKDFRASDNLDSQLGSLLSVAYCDEHEGKQATAWARYTTVAERAREREQPDRETFAREHAKALEVFVTHVRLTGVPAGAGVVVDDARARVAEDGTVLVPPGAHTLRVSAPGRDPWVRSVTIPEVRAPVDPRFDVVAPISTGTAGTLQASSGNTRRTIAWVALGTGAAGLVFGAASGIVALAELSSLKSDCQAGGGSYPLECSRSVAQLTGRNDSVKTAAAVSTVGFALAGVGAALGVPLFLTAPRSQREGAARLEPELWVGGGGAVVRGRF